MQRGYYVLVMLAVFGLPSTSVTGALALLTLPMSEDHRGILAFLVMIRSLIPILFLGFDVLNLIVAVWQFLVFA